MDLSFTKEEMAFRDEVRAFFRDNVPPATRQKLQEGRHLSKQEMIDWWRILNRKGWGVSHWPKEYGGTGWSSVQHYIFNEELQMAPAPLAFGVSMVGPVIYTFGNEQQKKHYLPRIANVDDWWCQGFSEPGSGSDLASLKTRAVRDGDHYVVTGQKIWTTLGHYGDWIFCLVRTDTKTEKRQDGISFLLIDMKTPGITVRPIVLMDQGHEVNEVFFDNVEVPRNRVFCDGNLAVYNSVMSASWRANAMHQTMIRAWTRRGTSSGTRWRRCSTVARTAATASPPPSTPGRWRR